MYQSVFTALLEIVGILTVSAAHHSRFLIPASSLLSDLIQGLSLIKGQTYVLRQRKLEEVWGMCYSGPMGLAFKPQRRLVERKSYGLPEVLLYHLKNSVRINPSAKRSG